jgi:hypothetical protein
MRAKKQPLTALRRRGEERSASSEIVLSDGKIRIPPSKGADLIIV